jgi:TolB-like protein/Tfp pilus assembly protein PilF
MSDRNFFAELRRRNVYKVAVAYAVIGWLVMQVAATVVPALHLPESITTAVVVLTLLGFPIALVIAWAFEMTPEGMKRTENISPNETIPQWSRRKFALFITGVAAIAIGLYAYQFVRSKNTTRVLTNATLPPATAPAAIPEKSIAVLPFDNLSDDKSNAYFAEGVQDEILTRLAKVADLKVIARTSTQKFRSAPENLPEIAKQLGVMNILEGSVQKVNDQVRVNVQLINAATEAHLWAEIYDRKLTDIFAVESDIAKTIAGTLQAKLSGSEKLLMAKKPTVNPEAYELYLKGRFFWNKRTAEDLRKAIDYFNAAIAKDPDYALAYAAVAQSWLILPAYGGGSPKECIPPAEAAISKALALDESSSDAHAARGMILSGYQFDFPGGKKEYERALQLNPNDATAHHWLASDVLGALGESESEIAEMRQARDLDPLSLVINTNLGAALLRAHRVDEAIAQLRKTVLLDSRFGYARQTLGMALESKGQIPEAIAEYQAAIALDASPTYLSLLGHLYGTTGRKDEARKLLGQIQDISKSRYVDPYYLAIVHLGLGERELALSALEKSFAELNGNTLEYIRSDPYLDPLRGDPRFEALAEKIVPAREFKGAPTSR